MNARDNRRRKARARRRLESWRHKHDVTPGIAEASFDRDHAGKSCQYCRLPVSGGCACCNAEDFRFAVHFLRMHIGPLSDEAEVARAKAYLDGWRDHAPFIAEGLIATHLKNQSTYDLLDSIEKWSKEVQEFSRALFGFRVAAPFNERLRELDEVKPVSEVLAMASRIVAKRSRGHRF